MLKSSKLYIYFFSTIQRIKGCLKKNSKMKVMKPETVLYI